MGDTGGIGWYTGWKRCFQYFYFPPNYSTIIDHLDDDLEQKRAGAKLSQAQVELKILVGVEVAVEVRR